VGPVPTTKVNLTTPLSRFNELIVFGAGPGGLACHDIFNPELEEFAAGIAKQSGGSQIEVEVATIRVGYDDRVSQIVDDSTEPRFIEMRFHGQRI
jgi:hypothetical protein